MRFIVAGLIVLTACCWLWAATEPDNVVGKLNVKVGPGWDTDFKVKLAGWTCMVGHRTYKLCLVDTYGQHVDVDVSKEDFAKAKFGEWQAYRVARVRKHYSVDWFRLE